MARNKADIKTIALELIVFNTVKNYFEENSIKNTEYFNKVNDFTLEKVVLLPFFFAIASSNRDLFLDIFDSFIPSSIGIIDNESELLVQNVFHFEDSFLVLDEREFPSIESIEKYLLSKNEIEYTGVLLVDEISSALRHLNSRIQNFSSIDFRILSNLSKLNLSFEIYNDDFYGNINFKNFKENLRKENFLISPPKMALANR